MIDNEIDIKTFRKPTHKRIIIEFFHQILYEMLVTHSYANRRFNIPLSQTSFRNYLHNIDEVVIMNGFNDNIIKNIGNEK